MSGRAPRLVAHGNYNEAVASALLDPWAPGASDVLSKHGPASELADLAEVDQRHLLLDYAAAQRIQRILPGVECSEAAAQRNVLVACKHSLSLKLHTLANLIHKFLPSADAEEFVVHMIRSGQLVGLVDQISGVVTIQSTEVGFDSLHERINDLAMEIELAEEW